MKILVCTHTHDEPNALDRTNRRLSDTHRFRRRRRRRVRSAHRASPGARSPVHVGRVPPGPGHCGRGRGRTTGRGRETAGRRRQRRRWPARTITIRIVVGHVQVGPVVHAHRQQGDRATPRRTNRRVAVVGGGGGGGRRTVAEIAVAVHVKRIA